MDYKRYIGERLHIEGVSAEEILGTLSVPPDSSMGDYALPCFKIAKILRKSPALIAEGLASEYPLDETVVEAKAVNGYVNFRVGKKSFVQNFLSEFSEQGENFGSSEEGKGKTVLIDYSSVNIAKPFHIGHLSTTVLGAALYRIHRFLGYHVASITSATTARSSENSSPPTKSGGTKRKSKRAAFTP